MHRRYIRWEIKFEFESIQVNSLTHTHNLTVDSLGKNNRTSPTYLYWIIMKVIGVNININLKSSGCFLSVNQRQLIKEMYEHWYHKNIHCIRIINGVCFFFRFFYLPTLHLYRVHTIKFGIGLFQPSELKTF